MQLKSLKHKGECVLKCKFLIKCIKNWQMFYQINMSCKLIKSDREIQRKKKWTNESSADMWYQGPEWRRGDKVFRSNMLAWLYSCSESPLRLALFLLKAFKCGISAIFSISSPRKQKMFLNSEDFSVIKESVLISVYIFEA